MSYVKVEPNLMKVAEVISKLIYRNGSLCVTFSQIRRETMFHPQTLTNLLEKGKTIGLITECKDLGLGENGYTILQNTVVSLEYSVINEIIKITDNHIIMKHLIKNRLYNNSILPLKGIIVKIFGDVLLDMPFIFKGRNNYEIDLTKNISDKYYIFYLDSDIEIKPGETYNYEYEFYLKYFPPMDYFITESINYVMTYSAKTYLTKNEKRVIKSVRLEYPPDVKIIEEKQGKTFHEVKIIKLSSCRSIKFWFHI
ncbi:hypothetical protein DDW12_07755 [Sulfolobus islandicus]|nr:hypothetical protein DDW12_07755 [Sulfolobus islandicus]